jgi:hypothetical protein
MLASELITMLQEAINNNGDLQIATYSDSYEGHDSADGIEVVEHGENDGKDLAETFFCIS